MLDSGLLTIYQNCLTQLSLFIQDKDIEVIAFVGSKNLYNYPKLEIIELPKSKKNWLYRLYYEYYYFQKISKKLKPDIWLSMHDVTPNVVCDKIFVYCHNSNMFYKPSLKDWFLEFKVGVFHYCYKFIYQKNITKNKAVFVQQNWLKNELKKIFKIDNIIVATPEFIKVNETNIINLEQDKIHFFYPSIPRVFKNFECVCEAFILLPDRIKQKIKIHLTIADNENKYATNIVKKYNFDQINFIGKLTKSDVFAYYNRIDCLLFPSKLETWGLPITEAKAYNKPMFLADLPYAKETVGDYDAVSFFKIDAPQELANLMTAFVDKTIVYEGNKYQFETKDQLNTWYKLFDYMLQ